MARWCPWRLVQRDQHWDCNRSQRHGHALLESSSHLNRDGGIESTEAVLASRFGHVLAWQRQADCCPSIEIL